MKQKDSLRKYILETFTYKNDIIVILNILKPKLGSKIILRNGKSSTATTLCIHMDRLKTCETVDSWRKLKMKIEIHVKNETIVQSIQRHTVESF